MDNKKSQQISIILPILLAVSFIMLLLYLMFGMFDRQLNMTNEMNAPDSAVINHGEFGNLDMQSSRSRFDSSCYMRVIQEQLAEYGEPRPVKVSDAPGVISQVFNPDMYYMDGAFIQLLDFDGDGKLELYCAAVDHEQTRIAAKIYCLQNDEVVLMTEDFPVMLMPEETEQTVFMKTSLTGGFYLVHETYNPQEKPVVLMEFSQKTGASFVSCGKYLRGKGKDAGPFGNYIRVESVSAIPLSLETDDRTGNAKTASTFPQAGVSEEQIMEYVQASADTISRILQQQT